MLKNKLRNLAEEKILNEKKTNNDLQDEAKLVHELRVHQIELEMQNEELRNTRNDLENSKLRYFELFDLAPIGYCILNENGNVLEANFTMAKLLDIERAEVIKQIITSFIFKDDQDIYYFFKKKLMHSSEPRSCELRMLKKNKKLFWGRLEGIASKDQNGKYILRLAVSDVTKREVQLLETYRELKDTHDQLQSFNQSVSHDLQSPLNTITSFTDIIINEHYEKINDDVRKIFAHITAATTRMSAVLNGLQELSKHSRADLVKAKFDISKLAQSIVQDIKKISPERNIKFIIPENIQAYGDPRLVSTVLSNLLNNAYKYTSKKDHAIIEFGQMKIDGEDTYFLHDNGAGFDMRHIDKLFVPFERLHKNSDFPGTGIGLASVLRIIKRHGGKIWAQSQPDMGATFFFIL